MSNKNVPRQRSCICMYPPIDKRKCFTAWNKNVEQRFIHAPFIWCSYYPSNSIYVQSDVLSFYFQGVDLFTIFWEDKPRKKLLWKIIFLGSFCLFDKNLVVIIKKKVDVTKQFIWLKPNLSEVLFVTCTKDFGYSYQTRDRICTDARKPSF